MLFTCIGCLKLVITSELLEGYMEDQSTFNIKGTGIAYDGLQLLMLHSFVLREAVFNSHETVLCIFNRIFLGCELLSTCTEYMGGQ